MAICIEMKELQQIHFKFIHSDNLSWKKVSLVSSYMRSFILG
jgi:hypothetical protein